MQINLSKITLGKKTATIIKQNLFFAVGFNLFMFFLAATGIISMILGAVLHQVSSLIVIMNAMRILFL